MTIFGSRVPDGHRVHIRPSDWQRVESVVSGGGCLGTDKGMSNRQLSNNSGEDEPEPACIAGDSVRRDSRGVILVDPHEDMKELTDKGGEEDNARLVDVEAVAVVYPNKAFSTAKGAAMNLRNRGLPKNFHCEAFSLGLFTAEKPCIVLVVGSESPAHSDGITAIREHEEIAKRAAKVTGFYQKLVVLDYEPLDIGTLAELLTEKQPNVLVFACHGNEKSVITATGEVVSYDRVFSIVDNCSAEVLILGCCNSGPLARYLVDRSDSTSAAFAVGRCPLNEHAEVHSAVLIAALRDGKSVFEMVAAAKMGVGGVAGSSDLHHVKLFTKAISRGSAGEVPFVFDVHQAPAPRMVLCHQERDDVTTILDLHRCCVIHGASGSGKTVLATDLAQCYRKIAVNGNASPTAKCLYVNVGAPHGHTWPQFVAGLKNLWSFRMGQSASDIGSAEDSASLAAFLDKHITLVTIDNVHLLKESAEFLKKLAGVIQRVQKCKLLLLSQLPLDTIGSHPVACLQKRGFKPDEALSLFAILNPELSREQLERHKADLLLLRDRTDGHVSALHHIMLVPSKIKECLEGDVQLGLEAERVLTVSFGKLEAEEQALLRTMSLLQGRVSRQWAFRLAVELGCGNATVNRLCSSHWLIEHYNTDAGLSRDTALLSINDFERAFLRGIELNPEEEHSRISAVYDLLLSPHLFYDSFDCLTPEEHPFFPNHMESAVEEALHVVPIASLPRMVGFDALLQMVYHFLSSRDLEYARRACRYLLILERLLYKYNRGAEAVFYVDMCMELLQAEEIFAQFKVRKIRTAITAERWDTAIAAISQLVEQYEPLKATNNLYAVGRELNGDLFRAKKEWQPAIGHYTVSRECFESLAVPDPKGMASSSFGLADCYHGQREYETACKWYVTAAELSLQKECRSDFYACRNYRLASLCAQRSNKPGGEAYRHFFEAAHHMDACRHLSGQTGSMTQLMQQQGQELMGERRPIALLFDCDGVIVDTEVLKLRAWQAMLRSDWVLTEPYWLAAEDYYTLAGADLWTIWERLKGEFLPPDTELLPDVTIPQAFEEAYERERERERRRQELEGKSGFSLEIPGSTRMFIAALTACRLYAKDGNIKVAVVSSDTTERVRENLITVGVDPESVPIFSVVEECVAAKPSPAVYQRAMEKLGVTKRNCVVLEDSVAGVEAATAAGARCIAVVNSHTRKLDFSKASRMFVTDEDSATNPYRLLGWALRTDPNAFRPLPSHTPGGP